MPKAIVPDPLRCEKCGSLEFTEAEFRQYRKDWYASAVAHHESSANSA
jgi:hypothetical protein